MDESVLPAANYSFEIRVDKSLSHAHSALQKLLLAYKGEKRGPTYIAVQSCFDFRQLTKIIPALADFPLVPVHVTDE